MARTVLQLIQQACYRSLIPAPSALVGETSTDTLQKLHLFYSVGEELRAAHCWSQLKRKYSFYLQEGRTQYTLPLDFYAPIPFTGTDLANSWPIDQIGDADYNYRTYAIAAVGNRKAFRIFGPDNNPNSSQGQFYVSPRPSAGDTNQRITIEYISKTWLIPPLWTPSETVAQNTYRFSCGNIYKKQDSGSEVGSTVPPNMAYGEGQDGGAKWVYISASAWASTTGYATGSYVTNGGNLYYATEGGISGASGPSGSTATQTDGTVTWAYKTISAWANYTEYSEGDLVTNASKRYRCIESGRSGSLGPNWTQTVLADGSIDWEHITTPYEAIVTDSDLCLFDDELLIAGLRSKYPNARGQDNMQILAEYEALKLAASSRWLHGKRFSMASTRYYGPTANLPEGSFG